MDVLRAEVPRGYFSRLEIPDTAGVRASACWAMLLGLSQLLAPHPLTRRQGESEKLSPAQGHRAGVGGPSV